MPVSSTNTNIPQKPEKNNAPGTKTRGKEGMSMKFRIANEDEILRQLTEVEEKAAALRSALVNLPGEFELEVAAENPTDLS